MPTAALTTGSPAWTPTTAPSARASRRTSHRAGFWFAAAAFAVLMGFGTAPTPLWPQYAARDDFGPTTLTVAFALLVVGAAASFLTLGHLSDRHGRRRLIIPALLLSIGASFVLLIWPSLPGLLVGRLLTGVGVGLMASTATTYLTDLYVRANPHRPQSPVPGVVATAANLGGLALGPLVAGIIAQWAPIPLFTAQAAFGVAMIVALVLIAFCPETVDTGARDRTPPARFALVPRGGLAFAAAGGLAFVAFGGFGLFSSLGAVMIHGRLGIASPLVGGIPSFLTFVAAATGQLAMGALPARRVLAAGLVCLPAGLALVAVSLYHPALWLYLAAAVATGAGAGLLFKSGVTATGLLAVPASRAGVLAVLFVAAYAGMGVPVIVFSVAVQHLGMELAMIWFAALLSAMAAVSSAAVRGALR